MKAGRAPGMGQGAAHDGDVEVERRFPLRVAAWAGGGLAAAVVVLLSVAYPGAAFSLAGHVRTSSLLLVGIAGAAAFLWWTPTVLAYFFGPSSLVIGRHQLRLGDKTLSYGEVVALRQHVSRDATYVLGRDGTRLKLRWPIWGEEGAWIELLFQRTYPSLHEAASRTLQMGTKVAFGRHVGLDRHHLYLKRRTIPLADITDLRFQSGSDSGTAYRKLKVYAAGSTHEIDEAKIENPHVFMGLIRGLLESGQRR